MRCEISLPHLAILIALMCGCTGTATPADDGAIPNGHSDGAPNECAPVPACPEADVVVVRPTLDTRVDVAVPSATARCGGQPPRVTVAPASVRSGATTVVARAENDRGVGECSFVVRVVDALAPDDLRITRARLLPDGRTEISLAWTPRAGAEIEAFDVIRADDGGETSTLATVDRDTTTYVDAQLGERGGTYRVLPRARGEVGQSSNVVRAERIEALRYDLRDERVRRVPFPTTLYGIVRAPVDRTRPHPLVIMMHGNHGICRRSAEDDLDQCMESTTHECTRRGYVTTPNAEGFAYLAETLAARGYVAVSVSANAMNCREDFIPERAELLLAHLAKWVVWSMDTATPFGDRFVRSVDPMRTILIGHSRGGEAVGLAPAHFDANPVDGAAIAGVFAIAPTDSHRPNPGGAPYAVLVPSCDGDVATLEGIDTYDRATRIDAGPASRRAQLLVGGANHNFFNTTWTIDDDGGSICSTQSSVGALAQRTVLEVVAPRFIEAALGGVLVVDDTDVDRDVVSFTRRAIDMRWSHSAADRTVVDDFGGASAPRRNRLGGENRFEGFATASACRGSGCSTSFPNGGIDAIRVDFAPGSRFQMELGAFDASRYDSFSFRWAAKYSSLETARRTDPVIRIVDTGGRALEVLGSELTSLRGPMTAATRLEALETFRVDFASAERDAPSFDRSRIARVEIAGTFGGAFLTDFAFSRDRRPP